MSTSTHALTRPTVRQLVEGLGAFFVLAAGVVGIPAVLATLIGWPLPHHLPGGAQVAGALRTPIPDSFWPHLFASLAWLVWAYFALCVAATVVTHLRGAEGTGRTGSGATAPPPPSSPRSSPPSSCSANSAPRRLDERASARPPP